MKRNPEKILIKIVCGCDFPFQLQFWPPEKIVFFYGMRNILKFSFRMAMSYRGIKKEK
jgi:hypothetical protein